MIIEISMKKVFIGLIVILFCSPCFCQVKIFNTKTEAHQLIPGTEIYMVPPPNFLSVGIPGFVFPTAGAMIAVTKIPESNFSNSENELKGIIEGQKLLGPVENLNFNGVEGKFFTSEEIRDGDPFTNHTLFFGNEDFVYLVIGVCPSDHPGIIESMKESIFSLIYQPNSKDPNSVSFSIQVDQTKLKDAGERSGMKFYTVDGNIPSESLDKTALVIGSSLYDVEIDDIKAFVVNRIKQLPYGNLSAREDQLREVKINGISGFEYDFKAQKGPDRPEELVYVLMLFSDSKYYMVIGNAFQDFDTNLELFKGVSATFELIEQD
jgi:hypothetical protein